MSHLQLPVVITPTRAELGARCHRRHFLSDVLGKALYRSPSLEFGSVIHAGAAQHWLGRDWRSVVQDEWTKRFDMGDQRPSQDNVSLPMAMAMMEHYVENAKLAGPFQDQGEWKRVDVEQRFELPLKDVKLSFQCDRMVYNAAENWLVIVDTKTAGRLDIKWDRTWETSLQMKLYKAGAKAVFDTGGRVSVVVEGLLKKVPSSIRYYECPDWSDSLVAEAMFNAYTIAGVDRDLITVTSDRVSNIMQPGQYTPVPNVQKATEFALRMTPVNYMDCYSYGIECPFRRLCTSPVEDRMAILAGEYFDITEESY
jgi:hypothetical protein